MANPGALMKEGTTLFTYNGETFQTYYKVFGDLENSSRLPFVMLHGGPGLVHDYLVPFSDLAVNASIPIILYDQIGNGKSTHLREKPKTFWTIDLFVAELDNLIKHFHIEDGFDLGGHSWGGILGAEYAVRCNPPGLKHLVLADSLVSTAKWMQSTMQLIQDFPEDVQQAFKAGMKEQDRYYEALKRFHAVHGCTLKPVPYEQSYALDMVFSMEGDPTVASAPIINHWTIEDRLHLIRVPTFVINGRADIAQDFVVAPFFQRIAKVKWVTFEKSSHTPHWEERDHFMRLLGDFLGL